MNENAKRWKSTRKRYVNLLMFWTISWVVTMAIVAFGPKYIWDYSITASIIAILVNTLIGLGMIMMNRKYINHMDELYKKINMDAMAFSLGLGIVGGLSYSMLDVTNVIQFDAEISLLVLFISVVYLIAIVVGRIRYK